MKNVIFACVHNAGRSQMAAAFFNQLANAEKGRATSAGTQPASSVHPEVVAVMREVGIELDHARPRSLTPELAAQAQFLITMGCGDACPMVPGARRDDWPVEDPQHKPIDDIRRIRDEIQHLVEQFIAAEDLG